MQLFPDFGIVIYSQTELSTKKPLENELINIFPCRHSNYGNKDHLYIVFRNKQAYKKLKTNIQLTIV